MRRNRAKAAVLALRRNGRVLFGRHKADVVKLQRLKVDRFLNQIAVLVADVLELRRGNAHIERAAGRVTVTGRFEPGLKRLPNDLFFQRRKDLEPGIESRSRRSCKCHRANPYQRLSMRRGRLFIDRFQAIEILEPEIKFPPGSEDFLFTFRCFCCP